MLTRANVCVGASARKGARSFAAIAEPDDEQREQISSQYDLGEISLLVVWERDLGRGERVLRTGDEIKNSRGSANGQLRVNVPMSTGTQVCAASLNHALFCVHA
eukprot:6175449-Pleurochrysis_carterae.AAC.2